MLLGVPKVYLDLDVLSYLAGIPRDEAWKTPVARRLADLARDGKIVVAVSMAAIEASFSRRVYQRNGEDAICVC